MATWNTTANDITWTAVDDPSVTWTVQLNPTVSGGGGTVDVVSNVAASRILGRVTAGSGDSEELTAAQVRTLIKNERVILHDELFASNTASVQVTITGYTVIEITFAGGSTRNASSDTLRLTVNNNTTDAIYSAQTAVAVTFGVQLSNEMPGIQTNTDRAGSLDATFHFLPGFRPSGVGRATSHLSTSTVSGNGRVFGYEIGTTATVNTIEIFFSIGSIAAGSRLMVVGR